jgi:hypothetical protein
MFVSFTVQHYQIHHVSDKIISKIKQKINKGSLFLISLPEILANKSRVPFYY